MTADILAAIDGALADCQTSSDAMRWAPPGSPEPDACDPVAVAFYVVGIRVDAASYLAAMRQVNEHVDRALVQMDAFTAAMAELEASAGVPAADPDGLRRGILAMAEGAEAEAGAEALVATA